MKRLNRIFACLIAFVMAGILVVPVVHATETADDEVLAVISQLNAIDSLQDIQDKRSKYTATGHYDINTTDKNVIVRHDTARIGYEAYVDAMFAARTAAQNAYNALTPAQKSQVDSLLASKLNNELQTVFNAGTFPVTPGDNEYTFETVDGGLGYAYEVSNHMVSGNIPQTFILVDTSDGKTSWTPNGLYEYGKSNYDVAYCCDVKTGLEYSADYKRLNLEDSHYYSKSAAEHIRAIVLNSYPFVTIEEMKANLKAGGLDKAFVDSLTRADMIAAVQSAIWTYANSADKWNNVGYFASIDVTRNTGIYFTPLHDYTNESWNWFPGKRTRSYNSQAAYRVNNLVYYLCTLDGIAASDNEIIISEVDITRANLINGTDDTYEIGMYVHLNTGAGSRDNLVITVTSYDGTGTITDKRAIAADESDTYALSVYARHGDYITVSVEGTQYLDKSVYFYEPEGGRDSSQCLVGVGGGKTKVKAEESFVFNKDIEMGLRIYKTETDSGLPISDITFDIYNVVLGEGESVGETPTDDELAKYMTDKYKIGSVTTDITGYASLSLDKGMYLVVEQHNPNKVKAPVSPFYIEVPMPVEVSGPDDGTETEIVVQYLDVVSIYPKNEPVETPDDPSDIPPYLDKVIGSFSVVKHDIRDESVKLSGASFQIFRKATADDTNVQIINYKGVRYEVAPVTVNGENLILRTDENGTATSPKLICGTYFLVETEAPDGYNVLAEAIPVMVKSELVSEIEIIHIANSPGDLFPSTGGSGTKWIIAIGSIITIITAVLLITKKKMSIYE